MRRDLVEFKDTLTSEQLLKRFKNQFELVRYAIQLAENTVRSGRETEVYTDSQNVAYQILAEIATNREQFAEIPVTSTLPMTKSHEKSHEPSWNDEVKALKEDKKEKRSRSKSDR